MTQYTYDHVGRKTQKSYANNAKVTHAYDAAGRVTGVTNKKSSGTAINTFVYENDKVGNRTKVTENGGGIVTWTYDKNYRLKSEVRTVSNAYTSAFTYDANGNRLTSTKDGATTTFTYDTADQITQSQDSAGTTTYNYDGAGNQTVATAPSNQKTTNTWNDENRLTRTQTPSGGDLQAVYRYDGLRYEKQDSSGTVRFVYDGQNYLLETTTAGSVTVAYTVEPRTYGDVVSKRASSTTHWYHHDALGSIRSLSNSSQTVTDTYLYDAWGNSITSSGSLPNPFRWVGAVGYYYNEVGTYYIRARNYSATIARWLNQDPLGRRGSGTNLSNYVGNAPINSVDPNGLLTRPLLPPSILGMRVPRQIGDGKYRCCSIAGKGKDWKAVNVFNNILPDGRSPSGVFSNFVYANIAFRQCCIKVNFAGLRFLSDSDVELIIGNDFRVTDSEFDLLASHHNAQSKVTAYWGDRKQDTGTVLGFSRSMQAFGHAEPPAPSLFVSKNAGSRTFPHELGHVLGLYHPVPEDVRLLMNQTRTDPAAATTTGDEIITESQCDTMRNHPNVL